MQITSEGQPGQTEASVLRSQYESHKSKTVMSSEYSVQVADAIKKNQALQDQTIRAELHAENASATSQAQLFRFQTELQSQRDEQRHALHESSTLRSDRSGMDLCIASISIDITICWDRLQRT